MRRGILGFATVGKTKLFKTLTGDALTTDADASDKPETHIGVAGARSRTPGPPASWRAASRGCALALE